MALSFDPNAPYLRTLIGGPHAGDYEDRAVEDSRGI